MEALSFNSLPEYIRKRMISEYEVYLDKNHKQMGLPLPEWKLEPSEIEDQLSKTPYCLYDGEYYKLTKL